MKLKLEAAFRDSTGEFVLESRGPRRLFDEARLTDPSSILQSEIDPSAGIDLNSALSTFILARVAHTRPNSTSNGRRMRMAWVRNTHIST